MRRFFSSILLLLWLDPSVLQVREGIINALHALRWLLHRNGVSPHVVKAQALKCNCNAARVRFAKIWERDMMFAWTSCSCSLFEFTPRKNAILNLGGARFALMFLWIVCKELEISYFVVQPHGFKRKLDEVKCSKCSGTWASLLGMRYCCLSRDSRARASMKTAERGEKDYLPALDF